MMEFNIWIREKKGSAWEQKAMGDAVFYRKANRKRNWSYMSPSPPTRRVIALFVLSHRVPWRSQPCARWRRAATGLRLKLIG